MTRLTTCMLGWLTVLMLAMASPALADHHEASAEAQGKGNAHAKGHEKSGTGPSAETRAKMAEAHEKLAACLRSTRPIDECRSEMKKAHHEAGQGGGCPHCEHGKGECSENGSCNGPGKAKGKGKSDKAPAPTPTTSGATQ